jgi:uncharacterized protein DUF262/HNH endonuclease
MSSKSKLVNLDALIKRADFGLEDYDDDEDAFETFDRVTLRDFGGDGAYLSPNLRKPDFQRETNHWSPEQILSLLQSFVDGDLVPSVILWKSPTYIFVIDGGHRLSAIKAWIEDDYGDGALSHEYFNRSIPIKQRKLADKTRSLVNSKIDSYTQINVMNKNQDLPPEKRKIITRIISRSLQVQWVKGDADKAEKSFFKINTQGTPLDSIEELLLKNRKKPISISARAIIRAGTGNKYWSKFGTNEISEIEELAKELNRTFFEPEINTPIKTLDLPLGGSTGVRSALQILIDLLQIVNKDNQGNLLTLDKYEDDLDGLSTIRLMKKTLTLAKRITGNDKGSLGLHPAIYFYGPTGRHSIPMFLGIMELFAQKIINNDKDFFKKFINQREFIENILANKKELISSILQKHRSPERIPAFKEFINDLVTKIDKNSILSDEAIVKIARLDGKIVLGDMLSNNRSFNNDAKSKSFIKTALASAIKCPICSGYLDPEKSVSYDHIQRISENGKGEASNCQLTHPYCNQSVKN